MILIIQFQSVKIGMRTVCNVSFQKQPMCLNLGAFNVFLLTPDLCLFAHSLPSPFSAEFLRDHCPQAPQTARQAPDALHAVQPEGKQEGKTPTVSAFTACGLGQVPAQLRRVRSSRTRWVFVRGADEGGDA